MLPERKPLRLQGYNYAQNGAYYITVCTHQRECLFGHIEDGVIMLNAMGLVVETEWLKTKSIRHDVILDEFIIMPNHMQMILKLGVGADSGPPLQQGWGILLKDLNQRQQLK
jgi:putative transposase